MLNNTIAKNLRSHKSEVVVTMLNEMLRGKITTFIVIDTDIGQLAQGAVAVNKDHRDIRRTAKRFNFIVEHT